MLKKPKRKQLSLSTLSDLKEQLDGNVVTSFNFLSACSEKLKESYEQLNEINSKYIRTKMRKVFIEIGRAHV